MAPTSKNDNGDAQLNRMIGTLGQLTDGNQDVNQQGSVAFFLKALLEFFKFVLNPPTADDDGPDLAPHQGNFRKSVTSYFKPSNLVSTAKELSEMRHNYSGDIHPISPVEGDGKVTSGFGHRDIPVGSHEHKGVDIGSRSGGNPYLRASMPGVVTGAGWLNGYGNTVTILGIDGKTYLTGHMASISVRKGQEVNQTTRIGVMGHTGTTDGGDHVHYEVRNENNVAIQPTLFDPSQQRDVALRKGDYLALSTSEQLLAMNQQVEQQKAVVASNRNQTGSTDMGSLLAQSGGVPPIQQSGGYVSPVTPGTRSPQGRQNGIGG